MIRIGIGITTHNHKELLKNLIESIKKHTTKIPYVLFCAVDGSNDGTVEMLIKEGIEFTHGSTIGQSLNKNRVFRRFLQYNYTFVLEDNLEIIRDGWIEEFISASSLLNLPFMFFEPRYYKHTFKTESMGYHILEWIDTYSPLLMFYTRKIMERVGGIDERFKNSGYGLIDQYTRMELAKLMPKEEKGFPTLASARKYIQLIECKHGYTYQQENIARCEDLEQKLLTENKITNNIYRKL